MARRHRRAAMRSAAIAGGVAGPYTAGEGQRRTAFAAAAPDIPSLGGWAPPLLSPDAAWLYERDVSIARIRDLERNSPWVGAGLDRLVDMLVGPGLRLNAKPDPDGLGITPEAANDLGRQIERQVWRPWANDPLFRCDATELQGFDGLAAMVAREFILVGEAIQVLRWLPEDGFPFATRMQAVDADRLSNPMGRPDDLFMRKGVERDDRGRPIAYHIRRAHLSEPTGGRADRFVWERIPRWDAVGGWRRPKVLHVYDRQREGQSRGVSKFVATLIPSKLVSSHAESEVRAAALNASIVGMIYSELGQQYAADVLGGDQVSGFNTEAMAALADARKDYYKNSQVMQEARFLSLLPTDKVELNTQPRQTAGFPAFQTAFLQTFAASLGISYEQLSMDWSRTNYSSARAALNEVWRSVSRLRGLLVAQFAQPIYAAVLEEALDKGLIEVPAGAKSFYEAPSAWLRANWIGPGRGYIDPTKEAQAAVMRMEARLSTLEREVAEQGYDWELDLDQHARERDEFDRRDLAPPGGWAVIDKPAPSPSETEALLDAQLDARPGDKPS